MKAIALFIGLAISVHVAPANAIAILKSGPDSCVSWMQERAAKSNKILFAQAWVLGFVSGIVYADATGSSDPLRNIDAAGAFAWIDQYCQAHPLDDVAVAAGGLALEVERRARGK